MHCTSLCLPPLPIISQPQYLSKILDTNQMPQKNMKQKLWIMSMVWVLLLCFNIAFLSNYWMHSVMAEENDTICIKIGMICFNFSICCFFVPQRKWMLKHSTREVHLQLHPQNRKRHCFSQLLSPVYSAKTRITVETLHCRRKEPHWCRRQRGWRGRLIETVTKQEQTDRQSLFRHWHVFPPTTRTWDGSKPAFFPQDQ